MEFKNTKNNQDYLTNRTAFCNLPENLETLLEHLHIKLWQLGLDTRIFMTGSRYHFDYLVHKPEVDYDFFFLVTNLETKDLLEEMLSKLYPSGKLVVSNSKYQDSSVAAVASLTLGSVKVDFQMIINEAMFEKKIKVNHNLYRNARWESVVRNAKLGLGHDAKRWLISPMWDVMLSQVEM